MDKITQYQHVIDDPKAPERLRGKVITATIIEGKSMDFEFQGPDDATPNEIGYFKWFIGELVDKLKANTQIEFGDSTFMKNAQRTHLPDQSNEIQ